MCTYCPLVDRFGSRFISTSGSESTSSDEDPSSFVSDMFLTFCFVLNPIHVSQGNEDASQFFSGKSQKYFTDTIHTIHPYATLKTL